MPPPPLHWQILLSDYASQPVMGVSKQGPQLLSVILVLANADLREICGSGKFRTRGDFNWDGENRFWLTDRAQSIHYNFWHDRTMIYEFVLVDLYIVQADNHRSGPVLGLNDCLRRIQILSQVRPSKHTWKGDWPHMGHWHDRTMIYEFVLVDLYIVHWYGP